MKILQASLFQNIDEQELSQMQEYRCMRRKKYEKNDIIFHTGERIFEICAVLSGSVVIENVDLWGNKSILNHLCAGQVFAETYVLCEEPMMVDAVCAENAEILFIDLKALLADGKAPWYPKMLRNLLMISAHMNLALSNRIFCTASKSIRSRLLTYLSKQAVKNNSTEFIIPFNRQQLADYLNLDRSALSKELGRMQKEGLLSFHKNRFKLFCTEKTM